jgi:hypothetical protein
LSLRSFLLSLLVFVTLAVPAHAVCIAATGADSSPTINQALANAGVGGKVYLCRSTIYYIKSTIRFAHSNQMLATETFDTGNTDLGQRARIHINDATLVTAVSGHDVPGSWLKWISIDGSAWWLGNVYKSPGALLDFGGTVTTSANGRTQEIHACEILEPRGWTSLLVSAGTGGCTGVKVTNNDIGPSGLPYDGYWADGISYQCRNGFVTGNYVWDATDGGIVVFGAPGSLIADNRVEAINRPALSAIALIDPSAGAGIFQTPTGDGDYRGTEVYHNWVSATGAFIKVGIGSGPFLWWPSCTDGARNDGALIHYNTVTGSYMGYGYPVDGVRNWRIQNNTDNATHVYSNRPSYPCTGQIAVPGRFQKYGARSQVTYSGNSHAAVEATLNGAAGLTY